MKTAGPGRADDVGQTAVSYCLTDFAGRVLASREPDLPFFGASTVKLGVLIAAMREVDAGRLSLDQELASKRRFASIAPPHAEFGMDDDEIDHGMPPVGQPMSLRAVLTRMVAVSSNEATNMVVELIGLAAVAEAFALCGAPAAAMQRYICDGAAAAAGLTLLITAHDLAALVRAVVTGAAASPASTAEMIAMMEAQEYAFLGAGLPAGVRFGSKSGWVQGIQHDGIYVSPTGRLDSGDNYVLAVCTRGYGEAEASELLAGFSQLALDRN